jgi:IclR family acetate operon transcriptional repressor
LTQLDGEVVGGRKAVHAGSDDDETGRSGYHVELPPGQRRVKNEQREGTTARTGQPAVRHVAAVERAFAVVDALADGQELGTNEIARRTGINASTVSRLLATLAAARFVEHVAETGRYRLSLRLVELGNAVLGRLDLRSLARPHLQALVRETGETATLSAPGEQDAVTVDFAHSSSVVQSVAQLGRPSVGHATAAGKVMLAFGDIELPSDPLTSFTPRTIATRSELVVELERVRRRGYAEAREEREADLAAVAAPVFDSRRDLVGIVGVQGPASRFDRRSMQAAMPLLLGHTAALSGELGLQV